MHPGVKQSAYLTKHLEPNRSMVAEIGLGRRSLIRRRLQPIQWFALVLLTLGQRAALQHGLFEETSKVPQVRLGSKPIKIDTETLKPSSNAPSTGVALGGQGRTLQDGQEIPQAASPVLAQLVPSGSDSAEVQKVVKVLGLGSVRPLEQMQTLNPKP